MALNYYIKSNGTDDYIQGDLVTAITTGFTLIWRGKFSVFGGSTGFDNLLCLYDKAGTEYLGIALDTSLTNKIKIISNGKTPGTGSTSLSLNTDYELKLTYDVSTNTASIYIDNVFEYSVNPTSGSTWSLLLDGYRLFTATTTSSFGTAYLSSSDIQDTSNSSNDIFLSVNESLGGSVLVDTSANNLDGTLFNIILSESLAEPTPAAIPNITTTSTQGLCRDAAHFYFINNTEIIKIDLAGNIVLTNTSPFVDLPAGSWKLNDPCVDGGLIYVAPRDISNSRRYIVVYNSSDLSYNTHYDISSYEDYGSSVCIGHTGNLLLPGYINTSSNIIALQVAEFTKTGTFVKYFTLSDYIYGMQGICYDGTNYYISSHDTVRSREYILRLDTSFSIEARVYPDTTYSEIEGLEYYDGKYYNNDVFEIPFIFNTETISVISITESLTNSNYTTNDPLISFTGTILVTEQLKNTNYTVLDPVISLVGGISITEQLENINYNTLDPIIDLTGLVDITENTVSTNYETTNPVITLTSGAIEIIEQTVNTQYQAKNPSILLTPEPLGIVSTVCFNGTITDVVFNGQDINLNYNGQSTTIEFSGNFNQVEFNGTIQTTCSNGSIKTNC